MLEPFPPSSRVTFYSHRSENGVQARNTATCLKVGLRRLLHDLPADDGRPGESDLVDEGVTSDTVADSGTVANQSGQIHRSDGAGRIYPTMMFTTPLGRPASLKSLVMYMAVSGVSSEGLRTTVQPVARAGATFQESMKRGYERSWVVFSCLVTERLTKFQGTVGIAKLTQL